MSDRLSKYRESSEAAELRKLLADTQRQLIYERARTVRLVNAIHEGARAAMLAQGPAKPVRPPRVDKRAAHEEEGLLHLSDWQVGKVTENFDMDVALARVRQLSDKVARLTGIERSDHPVKRLHILLGGDMAEGVTVFPGQKWEIQAGALEQVFTAASAVRDFTREMLALYERVVVWQVSGNHGLIGKRGDMPREDNLDNFVYRIAREQLTNEKRLTWHERYRWYEIVEIGNYHAMLVHGDQIKQFGGNLPIYGIIRKANAWASGVVEPFKDIYLGHFHRPDVGTLANGGRAFISPSLESANAYAAEFIAAQGFPGQRLHFVEPRKGRLAAERVVWLD